MAISGGKNLVTLHELQWIYCFKSPGGEILGKENVALGLFLSLEAI
jgi:hypothetical protein